MNTEDKNTAEFKRQETLTTIGATHVKVEKMYGEHRETLTTK